MANTESTALRKSESESTATRSLSTILWEIEPRLRVTPSDSLSSLNELIYITDSIIPTTVIATTPPIESTPPADEDSDEDAEEWHCDCTSGCGVSNSDECECVSTFGNFYTHPGTSGEAGKLNLDALPQNMPLVECGPACPCGLECSNRITQQGLKIPIHVNPCNEIGLGAFYDDTSALEKGTFICLYAGEYLSTTEANDRWSTTNRKQGEGNYILTLRLPGQKIHIDPTYKGNVGRFFNHSCNPTCVVQVVRWGGDSIWPIAAIFAKRDIEEGEELTYDYADASGVGGELHGAGEGGEGLTKCLCGARNCRGWMPFDPDVN